MKRGIKITDEEHKARRNDLYRFLLSRGDRWTPMRTVTDSINLYPTFYEKNYHNSGARRLLTGDIQAINDDPRYEKVIVSGDRGIKLANEKDFDNFINAESREIFQKLARLRRIIKNGSRNQQMDLNERIYQAFLGE